MSERDSRRETSREVRDEPGWFERDGVLFDEPQYSFPLLALLARIASQHGNTLHVVDIGGWGQSPDSRQVFHEEGWRAALAPMARALVIDPVAQDVEPGVRLPAGTTAA